MIDIRLIRENSEAVRANCVRRGFPIDIDGLLKLDADARQLGQEAEALRAERNRLSKECAKDPSARDKVKQLKGGARLQGGDARQNPGEDPAGGDPHAEHAWRRTFRTGWTTPATSRSGRSAKFLRSISRSATIRSSANCSTSSIFRAARKWRRPASTTGKGRGRCSRRRSISGSSACWSNAASRCS